MKNKQEAKREAYLQAAKIIESHANVVAERPTSPENERFVKALYDIADSLLDRGNKMKKSEPVLAKAA